MVRLSGIENNLLRSIGGPQFEDKGMTIQIPENSTTNWGALVDKSRSLKIGAQGRMCLPPMLLHPVKKISESEDYLHALELEGGNEAVWASVLKWIVGSMQHN